MQEFFFIKYIFIFVVILKFTFMKYPSSGSFGDKQTRKPKEKK